MHHISTLLVIIYKSCVKFVLQDLNKGARQIEISVNGETVFSGELDKGCGNQVFDYGKTVPLTEEGQQTDTQMDTLDVPNRQKQSHLSPQLVGMMDNVSLHSDCDSTPNQSINYEESHHSPEMEEPEVPRPGTRLINRATDPTIELPVIGSTTSEKLQQKSSTVKSKHKDKEKVRVKIPTKKESKDFQKSPSKTDVPSPSLPETRKPKRESETKDTTSSRDSKGIPYHVY